MQTNVNRMNQRQAAIVNPRLTDQQLAELDDALEAEYYDQLAERQDILFSMETSESELYYDFI